MNNKGITLISLVVTIIVLLILAGITIGTIFNDNGIIKKAQEAANATEDSAQNEQEALNGLLNDMDGIINGIGGGTTPTIGSINGKITWSTGSASLELTTDAEGVTIQYRKNSESSWIDYTSPVPSLLHGDKVYARGVKDGETVISEKQFDILDTTPPTVTIASSSSTTNSISATATATDNETGMGANPKYIFYIKKTSDPDSTYVEIANSTNASVTKNGLEQDTSYTIKVEVSDVAGNKGQTTKDITTSKIADAGDGLVSGAIVASTPVWSNGTASTTLSTDTGLTIQYQINGVDGSWTNGTNVTGLHHKDTVFARLTDGTNYGGEASVTILDTVAPGVAMTFSNTNVTTGERITATVVLSDGESGVNLTASKWICNTNAGAIGENEASYTNSFTNDSTTQAINLQLNTAGTYYLHVLAIDNAGNKREGISNAITVKKVLVADGSFNEDKGVNTPNLGEEMTSIKWDGSTWVETTGNDPDWYDYSAKKWANAKTSDGSMWVWIPRFAYSITSGYHSSTAGTIEVEFMKGLTNETSTGRTTFQNASGAGNWNIHPAFNYGETVSGLWVAKFEASRSDATSSSAGSIDTIKIQPTVQNWDKISMNDIYTNCLNYNKTLNSHLMKNDEWGAVAYLSKSKYGKDTEEIWINNSSDKITGSAGNSASASSNINDTEVTTDYTSTQGVKASTTGTIYGIYDMSGGGSEYVAAYVNGESEDLLDNGASLINGDIKTKNIYNTGNGSIDEYIVNADKYGDALYETSKAENNSSGSWFNDYSGFPGEFSPFFMRGGASLDNKYAGIFAFYLSSGTGRDYGGMAFRPVLIVL